MGLPAASSSSLSLRKTDSSRQDAWQPQRAAILPRTAAEVVDQHLLRVVKDRNGAGNEKDRHSMPILTFRLPDDKHGASKHWASQASAATTTSLRWLGHRGRRRFRWGMGWPRSLISMRNAIGSVDPLR
jgi:hypothetical protein